MTELGLFFIGTLFGFGCARYHAWAQGAEFQWRICESWSNRVLTYLVTRHGNEAGEAYIEALNATRFEE